MAVFAVLMPSSQPGVVEAIKTSFPDDHLALNDTQYLISFKGTASALTAQLGIWDASKPTATPTGLGVVLAFSAYSGRAPLEVWEWLKTKWESQSLG